MRIWTLLALLLVLACTDLSGSGQNIPNSCHTTDWFKLLSQANAGNASMLCKGVISASLERRSTAEYLFGSIISGHAKRDIQVEAHEALNNMYYKEGRYHLAIKQLDLELANDPNAADARGVRSMFAALSPLPDLTIVSTHCCPATSRTDSTGCKYHLSRYSSPSPEVPVKWVFSRIELG